MSATVIAISAVVLAIIAISACIGVTIQSEKEQVDDRTFSYLIKLKGVNLKNPDGTPIQDVISMMSAGDDVMLLRGDYEGNKSVRVDSYYGTIGFLPRRAAIIVTDLIESGTLGEAKIENIQPSRTRLSMEMTIRVGVENRLSIR